MIIEVQHNFIPEKEYILHVIFREFLGLDFTLKTVGKPQYSIVLPNHRKLVFSDSFFSRLEEDGNFYQTAQVPADVQFATNEFSPEEDLVVIFGNDEFEKGNDLVCGFDLFASAFFMLTRWEEMVSGVRDEHDRFPDQEALAVRFGFHHKPVVNEYVEFIRDALLHLGLKQPMKVRKFLPFITHDIDELYRYQKFSRVMRALAGDLIRRRSISSFLNTLRDSMAIRAGRKPDNYDTFDMLMDLSEAHGLTSHFYFIPGEPGEPDVRYSIGDKRVYEVVKTIKQRGHRVGMHASYSSYNDPGQFASEVDRMKKMDPEIEGGRQHYLRFKNPETFRLWADHHLGYDSTLGYSGDGGFRTGCCYPYPVFDLKNRRALDLMEKPVTVMEVGLRKKINSPGQFLERIAYYVDTVKKYNGEFVLVWHNSSFNTWEWNSDWLGVYKKTLNLLTG